MWTMCCASDATIYGQSNDSRYCDSSPYQTFLGGLSHNGASSTFAGAHNVSGQLEAQILGVTSWGCFGPAGGIGKVTSMIFAQIDIDRARLCHQTKSLRRDMRSHLVQGK